MSNSFCLDDGTMVYYQNTKKFKTISVRLIYESLYVDEEKTADTVLLVLLANSNQEFPVENEFVTRLCELYCTTFSARLNRRGNTSTIVFSSSIINSKFLQEDVNLLKECFHIMETSILKPAFTEKKFNRTIKNALERNERLFNNKKFYAEYQYNRLILENSPFLFDIKKFSECLKKLTLDDVILAYKRLLTKKRSLYIVGDITEDEIKEAYGKVNLGLNYDYPLDYMYLFPKRNLIVKKSEESLPINQSHLYVGYVSDIRGNDPRSFTVSLMCNMLAGTQYSSLFQVVRNQNGLAYNIDISCDHEEGIITIYAGIDEENYDKTLLLIEQIIKEYQDGKINQNIFEICKKDILNNLKKADDNINQYITYLRNETMKLDYYSFNDRYSQYEKITIDDVTEVINHFKLNTIYILKGKK